LRTYLVRRIVATIPVMGVVALIVFLLLHLAPGSPAALIAGDFATAEDIARIGRQLGLDRPLHVQFVAWVGQILRGDLGTSIFSHLPVSRLIRQRLEPTLVLSATTLVIAVVLAVPIGVLAAWRARTWVDRLVMGLSVCGLSIPSFVLGYLLIYLFAIHFGWLPVQGYVSVTGGLWPCVRSILLPSFALGSIYMALIARITRASLLEVLEEDYVRTAKAKGLSTLTVLVVHALRNASVPIVTIIGVGLTLLIGGVVITESVFAIPGIGRLTVDAILRRDYPIIQAVILLSSGVYVLVNLVIDLVYTILDPRIRY
jgi:peptide/nickel transport system permease protein